MRHAQARRLPNWLVGALTALVLIALSYLAFAHQFIRGFPWENTYEVQAVFKSSQGLTPASQVRIAGVKVGEVNAIEPLAPGSEVSASMPGGGASSQGTALVTLEIDDSGRPLHTDATMKLRPRLFLEGNLFLDLEPGTPGAPEAPDGFVFPAAQTSNSVQLDQVLTTLQSDVRARLQTALDELAGGLLRHGGAEGLNELYRTSPGAFRSSAQVSEALLGTEPRDLSGLVGNVDRVVRGLGRNEAELQGLVSGFNAVSGALAAESVALRAGVAELPNLLAAADPAFANLNASLPQVRALALEALPGVRSAPAALDVAIPFVRQLRGLASQAELRGLTADLRPTVPRLAQLSADAPRLFEEVSLLSNCVNDVITPWSNDSVSAGSAYPHPAVGKVYEELGYGLVGVGGESRSGDANGQYVRTLAGSGSNLVVIPPSLGQPEQVGLVPFPIVGSTPSIESSAKTPFRRDVACETQDPPDLDAGGVGPAPQQSTLANRPAAELSGPVGEAARRVEEIVLDPLALASSLDEGGDERAAAKVNESVAKRYRRFLTSGFDRYAQAILDEAGGG